MSRRHRKLTLTPHAGPAPAPDDPALPVPLQGSKNAGRWAQGGGRPMEPKGDVVVVEITLEAETSVLVCNASSFAREVDAAALARSLGLLFRLTAPL